MICPRCKCEYIEGVTECIDCKIPLKEESSFEQESKPYHPRFPILKTFPHRYQAHLAKGYLELYDIEAFVPQHKGDIWQPVVKYAYGGNFLIIREEDVDKAVEVFNDLPEPSRENEWEPPPFRQTVKIVSKIMLLMEVLRLGAFCRLVIGLLFEN